MIYGNYYLRRLRLRMGWLKIERIFTYELAWPGHHTESAKDLSLFLGNFRTLWPDTFGDEYIKSNVNYILGQLPKVDKNLSCTSSVLITSFR